MSSEQFIEEARQLVASYQFGDPVRIYRSNKKEQLKTIGCAIPILVLVELLVMIIGTHFDFSKLSLLVYSVVTLISILATSINLFSILQAPNLNIYICTAGVIAQHRSLIKAIRWEQIERIQQVSAEGPYAIYLVDTDIPGIVLNDNIQGINQLCEEIERKVMLTKHPDQTEALEQKETLEQKFEIAKHEEQERKKGSKERYLAHYQYLSSKDPGEALKLGEEYQLGETLGTYRSGFRSIFQKATFKYLMLVFLPFLFFSIDNLLHVGVTSFFIWLTIFAMPFIISRILSRNVRLHTYTKGFIFIHRSMDIIYWKQIEKADLPAIPFPTFCTMYLKNGEKLELYSFLEKQIEVSQLIKSKVAQTRDLSKSVSGTNSWYDENGRIGADYIQSSRPRDRYPDRDLGYRGW